MTNLEGARVRLRPATKADVPTLVAIRRTPEVLARWRGGDDLSAEVEDDLAEPGAHSFAVVVAERVAGWIQWSEVCEPDYRHGIIDWGSTLRRTTTRPSPVTRRSGSDGWASGA